MLFVKWNEQMKFFVIAQILLLAFLIVPVNADDIKNTKNNFNLVNTTKFLPPVDKQMHFIVGAGISRLVSVSTGSLLIGFIVSTAIGGAKEVIDQKTSGTSEFNDFLATSFGALFVIVFN